MKKPSDATFLHHMLDAIARVESFVTGIQEDEFQASDLRQSAVAHQIQILGEAARLVSATLKTQHPEVPWAGITGTRHRIVHDYTNLNSRMIWVVVRDDLPVLREQLRHILDSLESGTNAT